MRLPVIAFLAFLMTGATLAADPLRDQAKDLFEPIPKTPLSPENRRRRKNWRSARCSTSTRGFLKAAK
jgi:hypothetical protein